MDTYSILLHKLRIEIFICSIQFLFCPLMFPVAIKNLTEVIILEKLIGGINGGYQLWAPADTYSLIESCLWNNLLEQAHFMQAVFLNIDVVDEYKRVACLQ